MDTIEQNYFESTKLYASPGFHKTPYGQLLVTNKGYVTVASSEVEALVNQCGFSFSPPEEVKKEDEGIPDEPDVSTLTPFTEGAEGPDSPTPTDGNEGFDGTALPAGEEGTPPAEGPAPAEDTNVVADAAPAQTKKS